MMKLKARRLTKNLFSQPRMQSPQPPPTHPQASTRLSPAPFLLLLLLISVFIQKAHCWPSKDGNCAGDAVTFPFLDNQERSNILQGHIFQAGTPQTVAVT